MERRSTQDDGRYVHFGGDVVSNVESSHGVILSGGSTGGRVTVLSDDTNASLVIEAKNTGLLTVGNSSNRMSIPASTVTSTAAWSFTGSSFSVVGASSINLSPTSTAGITIGNSTFQNPILIRGSSVVIRSDSTGYITIGDSSQTASVEIIGSTITLSSTFVNIASTRVEIGGASTTGVSLFQRVRVDYTVPEIAANAVVTSTYTAVGLTTNATMMFASDALVAVHPNTVLVRPKCSTTDELRLDFANIAASTIGTGLSTTHGYLAWFAF